MSIFSGLNRMSNEYEVIDPLSVTIQEAKNEMERIERVVGVKKLDLSHKIKELDKELVVHSENYTNLKNFVEKFEDTIERTEESPESSSNS